MSRSRWAIRAPWRSSGPQHDTLPHDLVARVEAGAHRAARPLQKRAARTGRRRPVPEPAILAPFTGPARQVQSVQFSIARSAQFSVAIDSGTHSVGRTMSGRR